MVLKLVVIKVKFSYIIDLSSLKNVCVLVFWGEWEMVGPEHLSELVRNVLGDTDIIFYNSNIYWTIISFSNEVRHKFHRLSHPSAGIAAKANLSSWCYYGNWQIDKLYSRPADLLRIASHVVCGNRGSYCISGWVMCCEWDRRRACRVCPPLHLHITTSHGAASVITFTPSLRLQQLMLCTVYCRRTTFHISTRV